MEMPVINENKQRGRDLEKKFTRWLKHWENRGMLTIRAEVRTIYRNGKVIYTASQPCDYAILGKTVWALDAKECGSTTFYPSRQPKHQRDALNNAKQHGHRGGFVVWFYTQDPAGVNLRLIENLNQPATIDSGERFDWEKIH